VSDARDPGPLTSGPALTLGGVADAVRYDADGLVPCVCQDAATGEVLMVAWQDEAALTRTLASRRATFWSRSRGELWEKGATSGNVLAVEWARLDCDGDTVLLGVTPARPYGRPGPRAHAARKVGEEALEVVLAEPGSDALVGEVADLVFHALLLLAHDDVDPLAPLRVLAERRADG
jgi:phosphoribosyl-AMP cyclohydrolase